MDDQLEVRARRIAYRWHREDEPHATHEDGLMHAAACWREYVDLAQCPFLDDEPERLVVELD